MVRNPPFPPSEMQNQPPYATYPPSSEDSAGAPPPRPGLAAEYYGGPNQPGGYGGPQSQGYGGPAPPGYGTPPSQGYGQPGYTPAPIYGGGGSSGVPPRADSAPAQMTGEPNPAGGEPSAGGEEGERGVLGALAGGAAGAYAGHKMHHGIIGAAGGAFAGHKLEDAWKQHSADQKKAHEQQQQFEQQQKQFEAQRMQFEQQRMQFEQQQQQWQRQQQQFGGPPPPYGAQGYGAPPPQPPQEMRGNFSSSSEGTQLKHRGGNNWELVARCRRVNGHMAESRLALNNVLGNNDGHFAWANGGNGNFAASARGVRLVDGGRALEAELRRVDGSWNWSRVHLDERVGNNDGRLVLV